MGRHKTGVSSGLGADDEYRRSIGAMFAVYWLMRIGIDGERGFTFGVDGHWEAHRLWEWETEDEEPASFGLNQGRGAALSKCPLGSAPARLLRLLRARLAAPGSSALPESGPATGRPAPTSGTQASCLQSRRCCRL